MLVVFFNVLIEKFELCHFFFTIYALNFTERALKTVCCTFSVCHIIIILSHIYCKVHVYECYVCLIFMHECILLSLKHLSLQHFSYMVL